MIPAPLQDPPPTAESSWFPIPPDATWTLWSVILGGVALSIYLEQNYRWAARLSGPVLGLLMAMTLSTVGIMPTQAPSYAFIGDYLVPMAIPLLLAPPGRGST